MAYYFYKGEDERQMQFMVDEVADLQSLPTTTTSGTNGHDAVMAGSSAFCIENGSLYILNSSNEWKKI